MMISIRKRIPELKDSAKRILVFFLAIVSTILFVDRFGAYTFPKLIGQDYNHPSFTKLLIPILLISIMSAAIYEAIYYYTRLMKAVRKEEQSKQIAVEAQFDALRNQARPHFLFNSLNTLRDIIENDPKKEAIHFVEKLSDVYRFILESGNTKLITLEEEMKFAKAYIHIQSERFGDNIIINYNIPDDKLSSQMVPMSLQLLLENAIKHNVISKSNPLTINIYSKGKELKVENNIQLKSTNIPSTKVGLKNIEKRYALVSDRQVTIENDGVQFIVSIPLL